MGARTAPQPKENHVAERLKSDNADKALKNELSDQEKAGRLQAAIAAQLALDRERDTFNTKLRQRRDEQVLTIVRDELGMPSNTFAMFVRAQKLKDNSDKDEETWDAYQKHCRIGYAALGIGDQLNMLDVLDKAKGTKKAAKAKKSDAAPKNGGGSADEFQEDETSDTVAAAKAKGTDAGIEGRDLASNPYGAGSKQHQAFIVGWKAGQKTNAAGIRGPGETRAH